MLRLQGQFPIHAKGLLFDRLVGMGKSRKSCSPVGLTPLFGESQICGNVPNVESTKTGIPPAPGSLALRINVKLR